MKLSFSSLTKWLQHKSFGRHKTSTQEALIFRTRPEKKAPSLVQFQYLPRIIPQKEKGFFWAALVLFVIAAPIALGQWYFRSTDIVADVGGSYTEGLVGAPQHINPLLASLSDVDSDLASLVFSGLFIYNEQQELIPDLVTNYVISEDELTYTFFLRHGVQWHDSTKKEPHELDVDDVIFTIQAIQDTQYQSPLQSSLRGVVVAKVDETTFTLTLTEPFAPFLSSLTFGILPEHLWFNVPAQNVRLTELNVTPVGTGPFRFDQLTKDKAGNVKSFDLMRNEDYYEQQPYLDELHFIFYPDSITAVEALKSRKIEGLGFIPSTEKEGIEKKNADVTFASIRVPQYTAIFFNQKQSDVLKNDDVRMALAYAVNRDVIVDQVLQGEGEAIYTPILPGYVGHNADVEKYELNTEEAVRILEEDGWEFPEVEDVADDVPVEDVVEGEDGAVEEDTSVETNEDIFRPREKDGVKLEFTVATVDLPEYQSTLALLQDQWQAIGAKVNVDIYSPEDIQTGIIKDRDYEALLFGQIVGSDPDPYPFWHSSQQSHPGLALSIFRGPEIDTLLEEARQTSDAEERRLRYLHFQNNIAKEVPAIFLYNPLYSYGVHQKIQGINRQQYITAPSDRFSGITSWYIETQRDWK